MIKKTVIVFMVLFGLLNWWSYFWEGINIKEHAGVYIRNNVRHEKYLFSDKKYDMVLVGTSMSSNLNMSMISESGYNLSTEGGNMFSGISLIQKKGALPKHILIEMNALVRSEIDLIMQPYQKQLFNDIRSNLPLLQSKNRIICNSIVNSIPLYEKAIHILPKKAINRSVNNKDLKPISQIKKEDLNYNLNRLDSLIQFTQEKGIKITFVELPYDKERQDPEYTSVLEKIDEYKELDHIQTLYSKEFKDCELTDHVHMSLESSERFSEWISKRVK